MCVPVGNGVTSLLTSPCINVQGIKYMYSAVFVVVHGLGTKTGRKKGKGKLLTCYLFGQIEIVPLVCYMIC